MFQPELGRPCLHENVLFRAETEGVYARFCKKIPLNLRISRRWRNALTWHFEREE